MLSRAERTGSLDWNQREELYAPKIKAGPGIGNCFDQECCLEVIPSRYKLAFDF